LHHMVLFRTLAVAGALAGIAGCSTSGQSRLTSNAGAVPSLPSATSSIVVNATTPLLYASSNTANSVVVYKQGGTNQSPILTLTNGLNGPLGMFVDLNHDLYVANQPASTIVVFHRGATSPYKTLTDPGYYPGTVAVDSNGTVYVSNTQTTGGAAGNVVVYANGSTTPTSSLTMPPNTQVGNEAIDKNHNLWVNYLDPGLVDKVVKFVAEKNPAHATSIAVVQGRGLFFNSNNNLVIVDSGTPDVAIWAPPFHSLTSSCPADSGFRGITSSKVQKGYFVADVNVGSIQEYQYANCTLVDTITAGINPAAPATRVTSDPE
jgi:hypothetical protein